jgi:hypothetical protein
MPPHRELVKIVTARHLDDMTAASKLPLRPGRGTERTYATRVIINSAQVGVNVEMTPSAVALTHTH